MNQQRLSQLDGIRGFLCLLVILVHFPFKNSIFTDNFFINHAYVLVDLFFVLSGFVITLNYHDRISSPARLKSFLWSRFTRLFPLLFYTVILFLIVELFYLSFLSQYSHHQQTIKGALYSTVETLTFMNATPVFGNGPGMNYPSWSISAEMIAYCVFGFVMLGSPRRNKTWFIIILLLSIALPVAKLNYDLEGDWGFVRAIICFIMGNFSFRFYKRYENLKMFPLIEYVLPILLVLFLYCRNLLDIHQLYAAKEMVTMMFIPPFFAFFIFTYSLSNGIIVKALQGRFFQFIGKTSYSVYLNHAIVLFFINALVENIFHLGNNVWVVNLVLFASYPIIFLYSWYTWRIVEQKGRLLLSGKLKQPAKTVHDNAEPEVVPALNVVTQ
ncbi:MAG: acyltransferase [Chitinophagaceae bacterium]